LVLYYGPNRLGFSLGHILGLRGLLGLVGVLDQKIVGPTFVGLVERKLGHQPTPWSA